MDAQLPLLRESGALVVAAGAPFCVFELGGKPKGKGDQDQRIIVPRPGTKSWAMGKRKPFAIRYVPEDTEAYMEALAWCARAAMRGKEPTHRPTALLIHAFMPIYQSWPERKKQDALIGAIRPTEKPDWDNIGKMMDALKGIVWVDDAPVVDARVIKIYSQDPAVRVEVREFVPPG